MTITTNNCAAGDN